MGDMKEFNSVVDEYTAKFKEFPPIYKIGFSYSAKECMEKMKKAMKTGKKWELMYLPDREY